MQFGESHAYIWGASSEAVSQKALRTRLMDWALNRFVTNAFMLNEASMTDFLQKIRQQRPKVLFGYVSAIVEFAKFVEKHESNNIEFLHVITTAEILYPEQREIIERVFNSRVLNRYETKELGGIACECSKHTGMHMSVENTYVEILKDGVPVPVGQEGDIVVTNLNNYAMPFIRYHIGDVGQLSDLDLQCRCNRGAPMMKVIHGRANDIFKTKDGDSIHGLFFARLFYDMPEIKQFQVVQKSYDHIVVSIVEKTPMPQEQLTFLASSMKDIMTSDVKVEFKFLETIPLLASGKHRFTISEVV